MDSGHFLRIISLINESALRYVVVGGVSAVLHGNNRFTSDLDLVVELESDRLLVALEKLKSLGFQAKNPVDILDLAKVEKRSEWIEQKGALVLNLYRPEDKYFTVDIFLRYPFPFEEMYADAKLISVWNTPVRICSVDHLIAMKKRAGRPQDLLDIEAIETVQRRRSK